MQLLAMLPFADSAKIKDLPYNVTLLSIDAMQSVHNKDERISIDKLNKGIEVFKEFIKKANSSK